MKNLSKFKTPDIFLSYSHDDKEIVEKIAALLADAGFNCWIDSENLRYGDKYNEKIFEAISKCIVFIAFLSRSYVNKKYCPQEFEWAQEKDKDILAVTLDDVSENTNKKAAYMFSHLAGDSNPGFGKNISTDEDAHFIANELKKTFQLGELKSYYESNKKSDLPKIKLPEKYFSQLKFHNKQQYERDGNYALGDINSELFPAIKDITTNNYYVDKINHTSSLIKYIDDNQKNNVRKNLFLFGDGGMGKTITMLKTAEYLLNKDIPAIYIPLSKINLNKEDTIEEYLHKNVCGGNKGFWKILQDTMSMNYEDYPSVVLLLDGINELPVDREIAKRIVNDIKDKFIDGYKGVDLIITSRWYDAYVMNSLTDNLTKLEMQQLGKLSINKYLEKMGLPTVHDKKMLSVISTPLFLSLYADVEKHKNKYEYIEDIKLIENPDTSGKIFQNFFQTQLFRAAEEKNFDRATHYVLLDYMLPEIAYRMIKKHSNQMTISEEEVFEIQDEIEDKSKRYKWYTRDKLRKILGGGCNIDVDSLLTLARSLNFLHKTDEGYSLHQSFRDYFVACHIANEMLAFCKNNERKQETSPVLEEVCFDIDILKFVSDLIREEEATPYKENNGWVLPSKENMGISKTEQLLDLWRDAEGENAQNAIYNLFNVMSIGRKNKLFGCNFSRIDLRKCNLRGKMFVEWENENIYPSNFDEAWIDYASFLTEGHYATITALCTDEKEFIFSGDKSGVVKIFDINAQKCKKTTHFSNEPVVDMAWHSETKRLAIMYKNSIYIYSYDNEISQIIKNESQNGDFRYVDFDENGEVIVSYWLEPLIKKYLSGERLASIHPAFKYDVPARCAKWNPVRNEFVRSNLSQLVTIAHLDSANKWSMPLPFKDKISKNTHFNIQELIDVKKVFENIHSESENDGFEIFDLSNYVANSYLIKIDKTLYIYNELLQKITSKREFTCDVKKISCYSEQIVVQTDKISILLDPNLSVEGIFLNMRKFVVDNHSNVNCMVYSNDGSRLLIGIEKCLIEFETEGYTVVRKKQFNSNVGIACYIENKVVVSFGSKLHILNEDFSESNMVESDSGSEIKHYIKDWNNDGCYILSSDGVIKKLDSEFIVQRIRHVDSIANLSWAKYKRSGKVVLLLSKTKKHPYGVAFDFETGASDELLYNYDLLESFYLDNRDNTYYTMNNQIVTYKRTSPYQKLIFDNHSRIFIYGCSFINIKGDVVEHPEGKTFIHQNGGIINE